MPGPGQYTVDLSAKRSLREINPDLQYFGSTSERFGADPPAAGPGPGAYVPRQRVVMKSDWGQTTRFEQKPPSKKQPGPGEYNPLQTWSALATASLLGSTGQLAFGSMESRRGIAGGEGGAAPGPGAYDSGSAFRGADPAGEDARRRPPRLAGPPSRHEASGGDAAPPGGRGSWPVAEGPPPGTYDPVHPTDVSAVMRLPPRHEGFGSGATRAQPAKDSGSAGPGLYDADPGAVTGGKVSGTFNRCAVEGAPKAGRPKGLGFESQAHRVKTPSAAAKLPGPGAYSVAPSWTKKNFNVSFGDL